MTEYAENIMGGKITDCFLTAEVEMLDGNVSVYNSIISKIKLFCGRLDERDIEYRKTVEKELVAFENYVNSNYEL